MGPLDFFATLFGDAVTEERRLVIWESTHKRSSWFADIPSAATHALELSAKADVYFGTLLQDKKGQRGSARGEASGTRVLGGIWLDIDLAGPAHPKPGLPTSEGEVRKAVTALPLPPSLVLATGGGFHVWWILKEPFIIDTDAERTAIVAPTVEGWHNFCRQQMGFTLDPTHDLARVMRVPGTPNHKYACEIKPASWSSPKKRPLYNIGDFEQWRGAIKEEREVAETSFKLVAEASPPTEKFALLLEMEPKLRATWSRKRVMKSQSEYDFSIGSMAIHAGWKDQEVIDLLVAHRRAGGDKPEKLERAGYFAKTLGKLRAEHTQSDKVTEACEKIEESAKQPETATTKTTALEDLSTALGFAVERVIKYPADPPVFRIEMPSGGITLGGVETILMFSRFRAKIAASTGTVISKDLKRRWEDVARAILACVEVRDLGEASEPGGGVGAFLREYLGGLQRIGEDRNAAASAQSPWVEDGHVWFFSSRLQTWLSVRSIKLSFMELAVRMRNAGASPRTVAIKRDGRTTTARVWGIEASRVELSYVNGSVKEQS